jgi:hypothetical protein
MGRVSHVPRLWQDPDPTRSGRISAHLEDIAEKRIDIRLFGDELGAEVSEAVDRGAARAAPLRPMFTLRSLTTAYFPTREKVPIDVIESTGQEITCSSRLCFVCFAMERHEFSHGPCARKMGVHATGYVSPHG